MSCGSSALSADMTSLGPSKTNYTIQLKTLVFGDKCLHRQQANPIVNNVTIMRHLIVPTLPPLPHHLSYLGGWASAISVGRTQVICLLIWYKFGLREHKFKVSYRINFCYSFWPTNAIKHKYIIYLLKSISLHRGYNLFCYKRFRGIY